MALVCDFYMDELMLRLHHLCLKAAYSIVIRDYEHQ